jgi:preprotein translocase subunit SecD
VDSNLTTLIAAIFLFAYGSGPVRGFAITLCIGILANLFTAIFVSRAIFDWHLGLRGRVEHLSI